MVVSRFGINLNFWVKKDNFLICNNWDKLRGVLLGIYNVNNNSVWINYL